MSWMWCLCLSGCHRHLQCTETYAREYSTYFVSNGNCHEWQLYRNADNLFREDLMLGMTAHLSMDCVCQLSQETYHYFTVGAPYSLQQKNRHETKMNYRSHDHSLHILFEQVFLSGREAPKVTRQSFQLRSHPLLFHLHSFGSRTPRLMGAFTVRIEGLFI